MLIKIINCHKSEGIKSAAASPVLVPLRPAPELAGAGPGGRAAALLRGLRQGARIGRVAGLVLRLGRGRRVLVVAVVVAAAVALQRVLLAPEPARVSAACSGSAGSAGAVSPCCRSTSSVSAAPLLLPLLLLLLLPLLRPNSRSAALFLLGFFCLSILGGSTGTLLASFLCLCTVARLSL